MEKLIKKEVMRKGIMKVLREKAGRIRLMQEGGQILEEYMARLEHQVALALAAK